MPFTKFLDPKNDFAFKRIFGTERNQDILIEFINDMLGFAEESKIHMVTFLKTTQDPEIAAKKQSLIDVLCTDEHGRQYIVEMQIARARGFEKRAQYYAAKAYSRQLQQGEPYHDLKAVIFLAITDFVMFPDKENYKSDHVILDKESYSHDLQDFSFTFLELPKFKRTIEQLTSRVEKWAYFFKHAEATNEQELERIISGDNIIEKAYQELNRYGWSDIELNTYEQEEKRERDAQAIIAQQQLELAEAKAQIEAVKAEVEVGKAEVEVGKAQIEAGKAQIETVKAEVEATKTNYIEQGETKGKTDAVKAIALKALQKQLDLTEICELTGLSLAELQILKTEMTK